MIKSNNPTAIHSQQILLNALLSLMKEKKYCDITVKEICEHACLDRRTFYRHFDSKGDVLDLNVDILLKEYQIETRKLEIYSVYTISKCFFEFWEKHIEFIELLHRNNMVMQTLNKLGDYLFKVHSHVYFGMEENTDYKLAFYFGGYVNILINWVAKGVKNTPEDMAKIVNNIFSNEFYNIK